MSAWVTYADSRNRIREVRYEYEHRYVVTLPQRRLLTITTDRYIGIDVSVAESLADGLSNLDATTSNDVSVNMQPQGDGSVHIIHTVVSRAASWEDED